MKEAYPMVRLFLLSLLLQHAEFSLYPICISLFYRDNDKENTDNPQLLLKRTKPQIISYKKDDCIKKRTTFALYYYVTQIINYENEGFSTTYS